MIFATYSRIYDLGSAIDSNTEQFYVTVSNPCVDPSITTIQEGNPAISPEPASALTDQNYIVFDNALTFTHAEFSIVSSTSLCDGDLTYEATFDGSAIDDVVMSYDNTTRTYTVDTDDASLISATKPYTLKVTMNDYPIADYPTVDEAEHTANIIFDDPTNQAAICEDPSITTITATTQQATVTDDYSGTAKTWTFVDYTQFPNSTYCPLTVTVESISGPTSLIAASYQPDSDGVISFTFTNADYLATTYAPGNYTFSVKVTTGSSDAVSDTFDFTLVLTDPCASATVDTTPTMSSVTHTIYDSATVITLSDQFTSSPSYCTTTLNITAVTGSEGLTSDITLDDSA